MMRRNGMILDLDQEIRDHIEMATQERINRGMSPEEACHGALRRFGNVFLAHQFCSSAPSAVLRSGQLDDGLGKQFTASQSA